MPFSPPACPTEDELLRFTSGDLSTRRAAKVEAHLRGCSVCTEHIRVWNSTLGVYRQQAAKSGLDAPRWDGFSDALREEEQGWRRRQRAVRKRHRWSAAAAIAGTILAAWFWQKQTEVVLNAEEVIARAVVHERERPTSQLTSVRVRRTAPSDAGVSSETAALGPTAAQAIHQNADANAAASELVSSRGPLARELAWRLGPYGFDWSAPLSARHFQRWRQGAEARQDRLLSVDAELLKVFTSAEGPIRQAEIVVRQDTYEPVAQRWVFADGFQVEVTNLPEEPGVETPSSAVAAAPDIAKPPIAAAPLDLDALELNTRAALHRLGAVVGHDVAIRQVRERIRLEGVVATRETAQQIAAYARRHPAVDARVRPRAEAKSAEIAAGSPGLQAWLAQALADLALRGTFVSRTWELRDKTEVAAAALASLAQRYPPEVAAKLSSQSRHTLDDLALVLHRDLTARYEALERHLAPLIGTVSRPVMQEDLPSHWRTVGSTTVTELRELSTGLEHVLKTPDFSTSDTVVVAARERLRPALEALAASIAGRP